MNNELVSDDLWQTLQPLLPSERRTPRSRGRPRIPARAVLCGIVYVLKTGVPWKRLTKELGYGSGVTCWRRLKEWQRAGVFSLLLRRLLDSLVTRGLIDWSRACVDSASVPAKKGGELVGPNPTDRGKPGTKRHLFTDATGLPLAVLVTGANVHDCKVFEELLDAVPRSKVAEVDRGCDRRSCTRTRVTTSLSAVGRSTGGG
jgi:transposase